MRRAKFVPLARHEFLAQVAYYSREDPALGRRFSAAVEAATARALAYPFGGSPVGADTRRVLVRSFPFSVIYRSDAEGIIVFAVAHNARRPDYWSSRVQESRGRYESAVHDVDARFPSFSAKAEPVACHPQEAR